MLTCFKTIDASQVVYWVLLLFEVMYASQSRNAVLTEIHCLFIAITKCPNQNAQVFEV